MSIITSTPQSKTLPHVPLTIRSTVSAVAQSLNDMYGLGIDPCLFEDRHAYKDEDGLLRIDLVCLKTGAVCHTFKDRNTITKELSINDVMTNPKAFFYEKVVENFAVVVNTECELEFLKELKLDVRYNSGIPGATKSSELMDLLNRYNVSGGFSSSPSNTNTTAYFIPRYYGSGANAPDVYNFNRDAKLLVVVELMLMGEYKTHALMVG